MATAKKLPSGNWRVLVYTGKDEKGKRKYESYTAPTKKEAEYLAASALIKGEIKKSEGLTVAEALKRYIASKSSVLSPSTVATYKTSARIDYTPIENVLIGSLTLEAVQGFINAYASTHSPKTTRNVWGLLSSALRMFQPDKHYQITLPQKKKNEMKIPTTQQVEEMIQLTKGTPLGTAIILAALCGLRRSEICALEWRDVDFKRKTLSINKAVVRNDTHTLIVKTPKTEAGTRLISISDNVAGYLYALDRKARQIVNLTPSSLSKGFDRFKNTHSYNFRFHDLRHFHASMLLALNVPDKYAMKRMGHATTDMLKRVYQHVMEDKDKEVTDAINEKTEGFF